MQELPYKSYLLLQRLEEEKRQRDVEIKRRESERKKRHDILARDGKKSFFELDQAQSAGEIETTEKSTKAAEKVSHKKSEDETNTVTRKDTANIDGTPEPNENDMNALDYEADKDDNFNESIMDATSIVVQRAEVSVKDVTDKKTKVSKGDERERKSDRKDRKDAKKADKERKNRRSRSKSVEKRSKRRSRSRSPRRTDSRRDRDRRDVYRKRNYSPQRDNRRRDDYRDRRVQRDSRR